MSKERMSITIELEADNVQEVYGDISKALHKLNKDLPISITSIHYALKNVADKKPITSGIKQEDIDAADLYVQALQKHADAGGQFYWDAKGIHPITDNKDSGDKQ